jgi:hypothetical protein
MSEKKIKKRNIANYTGGVETADGRKLYGMDAENYLKVVIILYNRYYIFALM